MDDKINSNYKPYHCFEKLVESGVLSEYEVEIIISYITITTDKKRLKKRMADEFKTLSDKDIAYITKLNFSDYGKLSNKLLQGIEATIPEIGKKMTIILALWETNYNLMELLSDKFGYKALIDEHNKIYYKGENKSISKILDDMYVSNAVKRPVFRTLDIVKEIKQIEKCDLKKIFVEMARGDEKKQRTESRKAKLLERYKNINKDDFKEIREMLEHEPEERLNSKVLYLYYMQLGRCIYSGEIIDFNTLSDKLLYDKDHIYPQARVKDDSIDNLVLVKKEINGIKKDIIPIDENIRTKMNGFWHELARKELISKEKLYRLTRSTPFTDDELSGFIARQLVETRQSTKAITILLNEMFPNSEIVYVKAGLVGEFRHAFDMVKCREINDLHHAKDAYLNIVVGNIYNVKFTKNPINFLKEKATNCNYTIKLTAKEGQGMLSHDIIRGNECAWRADGSSLQTVISTIKKNNIQFVRYSTCQKGQFFNINIVKKSLGQVPIKSDIIFDIKKYGGYNNATVSYYYLIKHLKKGKSIISLIPIELYIADKIVSIDDIEKHCREHLLYIEPKVLLNARKIKRDSLWEIDGYKVSLSGKSNNDIWFKGGIQLILNSKWEKYIKNITTFVQKYSEASRRKAKTPIVTQYDKLDSERNFELYNILLNKLKFTPYKVLMPTPLDVMEKGLSIFTSLTTEEQILVLSHIVGLFRCNTSTGNDLSLIGGAKSTGILKMTMALNTKRFSKIYIIDQSPTGLFEKRSPNLLEL